jgi:hypothetical protein
MTKDTGIVLMGLKSLLRHYVGCGGFAPGALPRGAKEGKWPVRITAGDQ